MNLENITPVATKIRVFRAILGLSQAELAQRIKTNQRYISWYESGQGLPDPHTQQAIEGVFGVNFSDPAIEQAFVILASATGTNGHTAHPTAQ